MLFKATARELVGMTDKAFEMTRRAVEMEEEETKMRNLDIEKEKACQAMAEEEGRKRAAEEQGYFQELNDSHGPKGTRVLEEKLLQQAQQKEPQEEDGFFGVSDDEGGMSKKPRVTRKPKVTKKATKLLKKATITKRKVVAEEDSESDSTDPWGDMEDVISFRWEKKPKFIVRWSKCGETMEAAEHVLVDMPQKALEILWKNHRNSWPVLDWVNSLKVMKEAISDWKDIESYAARQQWDGSSEIPKVAAASKKIQTKLNGVGNRNAFGDLMEECIIAVTQTTNTTNKTATMANTTTTILRPGSPGLGESLHELGDTTTIPTTLNVNGLDEADDDTDDADDNTDDTDDPNKHNGQKLTYCRLTDHYWETCDKGAYVEPNGVLFGRSCLLCKVKFQPGIKRNGDDVENKYWLTLKKKVEHCTQCDVCLCVICYPLFMKQQGLMDKKRSPRKAKVQIKYNG